MSIGMSHIVYLVIRSLLNIDNELSSFFFLFKFFWSIISFFYWKRNLKLLFFFSNHVHWNKIKNLAEQKNFRERISKFIFFVIRFPFPININGQLEVEQFFFVDILVMINENMRFYFDHCIKSIENCLAHNRRKKD